LAGYEEGNQELLMPLEILVTLGAVVLVASITISGRVSVIAEKIDRTATTFVAQLLLRRSDKALEDALPRTILSN
jgi:hypothetical protein